MFGIYETSDSKLQQTDQYQSIDSPFDLLVELPWRETSSNSSAIIGGLSPAQTLSLVSTDLMLSDFARAEL